MSIEKKQVLVVDDQPNWQLALRVLLESEDYEVKVTTDLQEAEQAIANACTPFALAVLDLRLVDEEIENVHGLELITYIKAHSSSTKTILLTGYPEKLKGKPDADKLLFKVPEGSRFNSKEFKGTVRELLSEAK